MFDKNIFANRIKQLRTNKKISQTDLGNALGVTKNAISDIERVRRTTTIEKLYALANYFDVSADYLLGLSNDPNGTVTSKDVELIKQYYSLNERDKQLVNTILGLNR